jgi:transcriptional regulator with XRE-family HTH domain
MVDPAQRSTGERLARLRALAGLSARELGALAGVAPNTVSNIERGSTPSPDTAARIIDALTHALPRRTSELIAQAVERLRDAPCDELAAEGVRIAEERHARMTSALRTLAALQSIDALSEAIEDDDALEVVA